ncbi:16S rRNA (adenine(1518)-N(6)/adenine(1519)-N(6))-dimethyltransferase RsmA [Desulfolucanica intricata]|uniref:16S rRNA (adenine(1518)-N(6)/adenine(1519)-N(6))- dimethyltransferase RsmA n=1 Tax=Desulfolucanica intricata TaxID=1285191 RepID=UPI00082C359C|nr:16S rRNA (adenine(1518)-N(6)/adenine(1519)-N(6))-dimethyltransferase RsmA [Desulfolucanica intricata]
MSELASPSKVINILKQFNFHTRKKFGQNFLVDANIIQKIISAAELKQDDLVVEIGPGLGVLTEALANRVKQVYAVEIDRDLEPILEHNLKQYNNIKVLFEDALKTDFDNLILSETNEELGPGDKSYKLIANLPYYITTPLLMHILENKFNIELIVVMVQKEVAERMSALPGKKDYGALSVAVQYYTSPEIVCRVPRKVFMPVPEVDSAVIRLRKRKTPPVNLENELLFFRLVKAAFNKRRKTILNALEGSNLGLNKEEWDALIKKTGIDPRRRGETFSIQDFANLANSLWEFQNNS